MREQYNMSWDELFQRMSAIDIEGKKVYGVPLGGMVATGFLKKAINVTTPEEADIILDDVVDSGRTKRKYLAKYPDKKFTSLVDFGIPEDRELGRVVFPWDVAKTDDVYDIVLRLLQFYKKSVTDKNIETIIESVIDIKENECL